MYVDAMWIWLHVTIWIKAICGTIFLCHNIVRDSLIDRHIWKNIVQMRPPDSGQSTVATGGILNIHDTAKPRIPLLLHQEFLFSYN